MVINPFHQIYRPGRSPEPVELGKQNDWPRFKGCLSTGLNPPFRSEADDAAP